MVHSLPTSASCPAGLTSVLWILRGDDSLATRPNKPLSVRRNRFVWRFAAKMAITLQTFGLQRPHAGSLKEEVKKRPPKHSGPHQAEKLLG